MKLILLSLISTLIPLSGFSQILITGFGSSQFTIDGGSTTFASTSQTATSTTAIGSDTNIIAGTVSPINITGFQIIELSALVSGTNPNSQFFVDLYNNDFSQTRTYSGFLSSFGPAVTPVVLNFVSQTAAFTTIGGFQFNGAGGGSPLSITFDSISAVPEPTTMALFAASLTAVMVLRRRRHS